MQMNRTRSTLKSTSLPFLTRLGAQGEQLSATAFALVEKASGSRSSIAPSMVGVYSEQSTRTKLFWYREGRYILYVGRTNGTHSFDGESEIQ